MRNYDHSLSRWDGNLIIFTETSGIKEHGLHAETILLRTETAPPQAEVAASGPMEEIDEKN